MTLVLVEIDGDVAVEVDEGGTILKSISSPSIDRGPRPALEPDSPLPIPSCLRSPIVPTFTFSPTTPCIPAATPATSGSPSPSTPEVELTRRRLNVLRELHLHLLALRLLPGDGVSQRQVKADEVKDGAIENTYAGASGAAVDEGGGASGPESFLGFDVGADDGAGTFSAEEWRPEGAAGLADLVINPGQHVESASMSSWESTKRAGIRGLGLTQALAALRHLCCRQRRRRDLKRRPTRHGDIIAADSGWDDIKDCNKEGGEDSVRKWMCGEGCVGFGRHVSWTMLGGTFTALMPTSTFLRARLTLVELEAAWPSRPPSFVPCQVRVRVEGPQELSQNLHQQFVPTYTARPEPNRKLKLHLRALCLAFVKQKVQNNLLLRRSCH
ncbi:hypothetical protein GALMADRAFT_217581 [Galerina marginata CBS 339.88]|uniref:Uncharacterized protein n=1 Tax=Galerina marginata (strain CBS 339.88) TaxID=685588 RepID=A0A067S3G7_GALM3|nr:hypothetical protein GALMADRAFT_217581 [Galerina marginata CBS 339.88]